MAAAAEAAETAAVAETVMAVPAVVVGRAAPGGRVGLGLRLGAARFPRIVAAASVRGLPAAPCPSRSRGPRSRRCWAGRGRVSAAHRRQGRCDYDVKCARGRGAAGSQVGSVEEDVWQARGRVGRLGTASEEASTILTALI